MGELVETLAARTPLAPGPARERAADLLFFLTGPESYRAHVLATDWFQDESVHWTSETLCQTSSEVRWSMDHEGVDGHHTGGGGK